jgi:Rieske Fe-S protein
MSRPDQSGASRRRFIKVFALFSAGAAVHRSHGPTTALADVQAQTTRDGGVLRLSLIDFPALRQEYGSVRVGTSNVGANHMSTGLFAPVIINRAPGDVFYALEASCSHEGCIVPTLDRAAGLMQCPCHGSQYLIDGQVRRGPANFPLRQFETRYDGADRLTVGLPDISFALEVVQVEQPSGRLRLDFIAFEQIEYELHYRPDAVSDWVGPISFALTPSGPVDQTVILGQANIASVFVQASARAGFYAVVMRVKAV